jgi:hypothetical protein
MLSGRLRFMVARTLASVIVRRRLELVGLGPTPDAKDVELAVLRHRLMVWGPETRYAPGDLDFYAARSYSVMSPPRRGRRLIC